MRIPLVLTVVAACASPVETPAAAEHVKFKVEGDVVFFGVASHARGRVVVRQEVVEAVNLDVDDVDSFTLVDLLLGVQVVAPCDDADIVQHWSDDEGPLPTIKHKVVLDWDGSSLVLDSEDLQVHVHTAPVP